jgi:hypothetical protein
MFIWIWCNTDIPCSPMMCTSIVKNLKILVEETVRSTAVGTSRISHSHCLILSLSLSLSLSHPLSFSHSHSRTLSHSLTHSHTLSLTHSLWLTLNSLTLPLSHSHSLTLSPSHSLSLSPHSLFHSHSLSHSFSHSLTHSLTLSLTHSLFLSNARCYVTMWHEFVTNYMCIVYCATNNVYQTPCGHTPGIVLVQLFPSSMPCLAHI